ncbi:TonB-dependent receptor domain-containing protein [Halomonas sp. HMF6819]|uniref:TonB-dependent receptor domain-containing protein n=1 Tax=Halomonas sp. HMF6819 TaxID=3373085 RepID=UPI0037ABB94C
MARFTRTALASAIALGSFTVTAHAQQSATNLDSMVVTAAGYEQTLNNAPASISVVTRQELEQNQFSSIAEAIRDVPGVDVRAGTGKTGGQSISIRGMPSDYTLILIDGRRQNTSGDVTPNGFGSTSTSFMPPLSSIERIEVIRGPMSTLYGSDALGGVVNIITRRVGTDWAGSVTVENTFQEDRDAGNSSTLNLYATGPLIEDTLGVQLRGRVFDRDSSERLVEESVGRDPRPSEARIYSIGGRLSFTPNDTHEIWLDAERARQVYDNTDCRLGSRDGLRRNDCETPAPTEFFGYEDELRFQRDQIAIGHSARLSTGTWDTSITRNETESLGRTLPAGNAPDYGYFALGGEPRTLKNRDVVVDTKFVAPLDAHMVTVGGQYIDADLTDATAGNEEFSQSSWALFVEDEWFLTDDLALTLGGRYENHDAFGGHFSPRGYLVWNTTDEWTLKGGISQGYKTPTLNQLHDGVNGFGNQGNSASLGSPNLEPEKSTNYEIGAIYDNLDGFSAGATVFFTQFRDRISSGDDIPNCQFVDSDGNRPFSNAANCISVGDFVSQDSFNRSVNVDRAETRGVELTSSYQFDPAWRISGGYTYTDTEVTSGDNEGQALTNAPKHKLTADLSWAINPQWSTTLEGEYYSSRERFSGNVSGSSAALVEQLGNKLDGYELFNLRSTYRFTDSLRLTGTVYNLFDKDFGGYDTYNFDGDTYIAYDYTQTGRSTNGVALDGRSYWLSATYEF